MIAMGEPVAIDYGHDRLSNLPEDILHKILQIVGTKGAVRTSVLSKRWEKLWTSLPELDLDAKTFSDLDCFKNFVSHVLRSRDDESTVRKLRLYTRHKKKVTDEDLVNKVVGYAIRHRVNHLILEYENIGFPFPYPKELRSCGDQIPFETLELIRFKLPQSFGSTILTSLYLRSCQFPTRVRVRCLDPFTRCTNLKTLWLEGCYLQHPIETFRISVAEMINLTMRSVYGYFCECVEISAPMLTYFFFDFLNCRLSVLSIDLPRLESAHINLDMALYSNEENIYGILFTLLRGLCNARFITLSSTTIEELAFALALYGFYRQPSPDFYFHRLLKLMVSISSIELPAGSHIDDYKIPERVRTYLLSRSPSSATVQSVWFPGPRPAAVYSSGVEKETHPAHPSWSQDNQIFYIVM